MTTKKMLYRHFTFSHYLHSLRQIKTYILFFSGFVLHFSFLFSYWNPSYNKSPSICGLNVPHSTFSRSSDLPCLVAPPKFLLLVAHPSVSPYFFLFSSYCFRSLLFFFSFCLFLFWNTRKTDLEQTLKNSSKKKGEKEREKERK